MQTLLDPHDDQVNDPPVLGIDAHVNRKSD